MATRTETRRGIAKDPEYFAPIPREISLQLTYKCNLRCEHCFQWNDQGFFRSFPGEKQRTELEPSLISEILEFTRPTKAKTFLWGGEPLFHSRFPEIAMLLQRHERDVNICTNGLFLTRHRESLLGLGPGLSLLVSLDGNKEQHERLRGSGSFDRTMQNVQQLLALQHSGEFRGELSFSCMISEDTAGDLVTFAEFAEDLGVNSVYFQFPWFISPRVAAEMDSVYREHFSWLNLMDERSQPTWHSYSYSLPTASVESVRASMDALASRDWGVRIRYQPDLTAPELGPFLAGSSAPAQHRSQCLAVSNRLEVHADGSISSCKFFPEFVIGNAYTDNVNEVWSGPRFARVRQALQKHGLLPVCSKCILLYLNGI